MVAVRAEADAALARAEEAESANKNVSLLSPYFPLISIRSTHWHPHSPPMRAVQARTPRKGPTDHLSQAPARPRPDLAVRHRDPPRGVQVPRGRRGRAQDPGGELDEKGGHAGGGVGEDRKGVEGDPRKVRSLPSCEISPSTSYSDTCKPLPSVDSAQSTSRRNTLNASSPAPKKNATPSRPSTIRRSPSSRRVRPSWTRW